MATVSGRPLPPLLPARAATRRHWSVAATRLAARTFRVTEVHRETPDAVAIRLADINGRPVGHRPGEFMTLLVNVAGRQLRRAYSIASAPGDPRGILLVVKRVAQGVVSGFLNDSIAVGQTIDALGPSGNFVVETAPDARRELVLIGGGSGITPLMSITRAVLGDEVDSRVALIYGNRRLEDVIFRQALDALKSEHASRLALVHVLERPEPGWKGPVGLLDAATLEAQLDGLGPTPEAVYYLCGPTAMMAAARQVLLARGVGPDAILEERFHSPGKAPALPSASPQTVAVHWSGGTRQLTADVGQTLLEACLDAGLPMPFSCAMGGCGSCRVTLSEGQVAMDEPNCLSAEERAAGSILACVSRPAGPVSIRLRGEGS